MLGERQDGAVVLIYANLFNSGLALMAVMSSGLVHNMFFAP